MRVGLDWLAEFVALPADAELALRLNLGGFEDAFVENTGPDLTGLVVGHVVAREPHPDADRLSVCRVDTGAGEPLRVVCGAPNVAADQKIAFAPVGARLPDGTRLKKSKIRGVESHGMICSAHELGLSEERAGILVLAADAPIGAPLSQLLAGARVLEVGITPNRGDTASVLGIAREVSALVGGELTLPETQPPETGAPAAAHVAVVIHAADACHHYVARVVRGVKVGASPDWLVRKLESAGLRSINNVVDVTNLVLLEFGQPLHAFDLAAIRGGRIEVRRARSGEKLVCLDAVTRELDSADLVICDADGPLALAGVMGGAGSEVSAGTTDVLLESAHFQPTVVRLAARRHGLHTEASYRFERGVDRAGVLRAADRAARLLAELCGGAVCHGCVEARGSAPPVTEAIAFDVARANRLLGTAIEAATARALLARVGVAASEEPGGWLTCRIPSHRNDLHVQEDLTEEVARVFGYDRIPATLPLAELQAVAIPAAWELADLARDALAAAGLSEVVSLPFVPPGDCDALGLAAEDPRREHWTIVNPIREEEPALRTTLVPSLLRLAHQNLSRQVDHVELFELARVFRRAGGPGGEEPLALAALLTQRQDPGLWCPESTPGLFFRAKGVAERLLIQAGYVALWQRETAAPYLHPGAAAAIAVGGQVIGSVGELHPEVAARFGLGVPCALLELDLGALAAAPRREPRFREVSRQPLARRDLAVLLDRSLAAGDVLQAIQAAGGHDLISTELFDRYEGEGVPADKVSLAFRLAFQRPDRALTETELGQAIDRVVRMLAHRFGGELR